MKRLFQWIFAATLICSLNVFTSCSNDDDNAPVIENLSEKIIGKWMVTARDGNPAPTNRKKVYTFVSATKAYVSASIADNPVSGMWQEQMEADVVINGNKVTLTSHQNEHTTGVEEFIITDINDTDFTTNQKVNVTVDGRVVYSEDFALRFEKVTADYREAVLGLWECTGLTGIETYNDANARLEFFADGTYQFWRKNTAGGWEAVTTREFQDYFVDGTLLATRWKNQGEEELREWWEIKTLSGDEMVWTALRQNADGSTFQQDVKWKKVNARK